MLLKIAPLVFAVALHTGVATLLLALNHRPLAVGPAAHGHGVVATSVPVVWWSCYLWEIHPMDLCLNLLTVHDLL